MPAYGSAWVSLVQRTPRGAEAFLAKHPNMRPRKSVSHTNAADGKPRRGH